MLNQEFTTNGFSFIGPEYYLNEENSSSIHDLKKLFDLHLQEDGSQFRKRAYLKLHWLKSNGRINVPGNQNYYQTASSNQADGGKIRKFKVMDKSILNLPIVNSIVHKNLKMIEQYPSLQKEDLLTIGMHFIRYQVEESLASYSSPDWLHKDDEPLVFIHLVNLSRSALGGDNLIASSETKLVKHVIRLENEMETLVLNKSVYHAVTPLGSRKGTALRDVILFTIEPSYTQQMTGSDCA